MKKSILFFGTVILLTACNSSDKKAAEATASDTTAVTVDTSNHGSILNNNNASTSSASLADTSNFTTIEWIDKVNQTFPKIKEGKVLEVVYRFKNTGTKPFVVQDVSASCGCTVPEKPEKPILPGEEGVIKAKFDSKGKPGPNTKNITVLANTMSEKILSFSVEVEKE
jgi:major membrane immunogen (membrane-anchored lipoprotein)